MALDQGFSEEPECLGKDAWLRAEKRWLLLSLALWCQITNIPVEVSLCVDIESFRVSA